ncbi:hypothetical protein EIQ06_03840 [Xanthomonas campestris pv. campestris]
MRRVSTEQLANVRPGLLALQHTTSELSGAVSSPIAGPLAAWMPPSSPHGWVHGVSCERRGHRALDAASVRRGSCQSTLAGSAVNTS